MAIVKVKRRFSLTIPKEVRKKIPIRVGQMIEIKPENDVLLLRPLPEDPSERLGQLIGGLKAEELAEEAGRIVVKEAKSSLARKVKQR